jgi:hypothetical protein
MFYFLWQADMIPKIQLGHIAEKSLNLNFQILN